MEEEALSRLAEWAEEFSTEEEFVNAVPPTIQGVVEILLETADGKGFLTLDLFRQLIMYFQYSCCHFSTDVLNLNKEDYLKMCEVSYDAFSNLTSTHEISERKDH